MVRRGRIRRATALGELELAVLERLWAEGEDTVSGVFEAVGAPRGITLNTVGSALERLHRKGLLARWKVSHAYRYRAAVDRQTFLARRALEAAGGVAGLSREGVLAAFVDLVAEADEDGEVLAELDALVAAKRREQRD